MTRSIPVPKSIPSWVGRLGAAVWVSDPDGNIGYLNRRAEKLLGIRAEGAVGKPCHEVVAGRDSAGDPLCDPSCSVLACTRRDLEVEPFDLCVRDPAGDLHWVQVLIITIPGRDGGRPWRGRGSWPCRSSP